MESATGRVARAQSVSAEVEAATGKFSIHLRFITARSLSQAMRRTKSHEVYRQVLINAPTGKVDPGSGMSCYPTNRELGKLPFPRSGPRRTWRLTRYDNLPAMISRSNDADQPEPVARSSWRVRLCTALAGLVLFVGIEICPADVALILYIFAVAILLLSSIVMLVCAAIGKNRRRYLQQLSTLTILLGIAVGAFIFGRMYPFAIRSEARWLTSSQNYRALVLAQPSPPNNELKHIEWDGSRFAGIANNTVFLVFDPEDTLSTAAESGQPGKIRGIACDVRSVRRLESHWYAVLFYTDEY